MRRLLVCILSAITLISSAPAFALAASGNTESAASVQAAPFRDLPHLALAAARAGAARYTVRPGDTLSSVSRHLSGHASRWPELWLANRDRVRNPDMIRPGQRLVMPRWRKLESWMAATALAVMPKPELAPRPVQHAAATVVHVVRRYRCGDGDGDGFDMPCSKLPGHQAAAAPAPAAPAPAPQPAAQTATYNGGGGFEACVIAAESGGNPGAVNPSSGAGGLYGFLPSTWQSLGYSGLPENASPATQHEAFTREYARAGTAPWAPYDGC